MDEIKKLEQLADLDNCDGNCDINPPYKKCPRCYAITVLNEVGEIVREAIKEIESMEVV